MHFLYILLRLHVIFVLLKINLYHHRTIYNYFKIWVNKYVDSKLTITFLKIFIVVYVQVICQLPIFTSHLFTPLVCTVHTVKQSCTTIAMQIYQLRYRCKISTLTNLDHHMFHPLILSPFQPAESKWERKGKREGNGRGKTAALQRHSLHHRALLPGWRHVLFPLLHKYTPTIHSLSTWSSPAVCPVLLRQRHGEGCSDVDRPEAGVTWGSRSS